MHVQCNTLETPLSVTVNFYPLLTLGITTVLPCAIMWY